MPQRAKGARIWLRESTGIYLIRDTGRPERSTGTRDRREAEAALAAYIAQRDRPAGPADASEMTISEALAIYGEQHAPHVKDPARIGYAIAALDPFWGGLPVSAITSETCRRYAKSRVKPGRKDPETGELAEWLPIAAGTIRKELGTLSAALEYCRREGYLLSAPAVALPEKPPAKDRWLTRDEAAALIRAAWRNPKAKHLARFALVALYTGTRKATILGLQFRPNTTGGWIDTEHGIIYRRAVAATETKKRQTTARIPRQLLAHLRRWEHKGARFVVEIDGARVGSIKRAWRTAVAEAGIEPATPHALRHTAITWAMQRGAQKWDVCGFFGVSMDTLERVYGHHHPDHQASAVEAMERRR